MKKKIIIYYFSGTGNTECISRLLKNEFENKKIQTDLVKIENIVNNLQKINNNEYEYIGLAHPVLGFDVPGIIYKFIKLLPKDKNKKMFLFKTAAAYHNLNFGASKAAIKKIKKRGYDVFHESLIAMPSNWMVRYEDNLSKQLYDTAYIKVKRIADDILSNKKHQIHAGFLLKILARISNYLEDEWGARWFGKFLKVKKNCIDCGKCIKNCPVKNMYKNKTGKIKFRFKCTWCMRCIYSCPVNAIKPRIFKFSELKDGYDLNNIIKNSEIEGNYINKNTKKFNKTFYKYLFDDNIY